MTKEAKKGLRIIPTGERKCIWMDAGVVSYKLCVNQFQCNTCEFDSAMANRVKKSKADAMSDQPIKNQKKEIVDWMAEFKNLPADQRKCRYMLMGEVSYKICPNSFRCGECTFDQMMQDSIQPVMESETNQLPMVAGFHVNDNLYHFRNHTWLRLERNGQYRVGIDDFARRMIGKPKGVKLPPIGREIDMEEYTWSVLHELGDIEFFSPLKGVVTATNQALLEDASLLNQDPYNKGWLMVVDPPSIARSVRNFLKGEETRNWMVEEANHLTASLQKEAGMTMHDGASLVLDFGNQLSKEHWQAIMKKHLFGR